MSVSQGLNRTQHVLRHWGKRGAAAAAAAGRRFQSGDLRPQLQEQEQQQVSRPGRGYDESTCTQRRQWLEHYTGVRVPYIATWWGDDGKTPTTTVRRHCENPIGTAKIPMGLVGPMDICFDGSDETEEVIAPFATLEGSLIASVCRGAKLINMCGGIHTCSVSQQVTRAPLFILRNPYEAVRFGRWAEACTEQLRQIAHQHTAHGHLLRVSPFFDGSAVHLQFVYSTGDASGQNMTTICTSPCISWLREQAPRQAGVRVQFSSITGTQDGDKRTATSLSILGRGHHVAAAVDVPDAVLRDLFRISTHQLMAYWYPYQDRVQGRIGVNCKNINMSNVIAGLFAATGQDLGAVPESSQAQFGVSTLPSGEPGVRVEGVFPSLVLGTVGGGTGLPTQRESLQLLNCGGAGKASRLAQIIAAFAVAQDLSIAGALVSDEFTQAHIDFARK